MHITTRGLIVSALYLSAVLSSLFVTDVNAEGLKLDIGVGVHKYNKRGFQQTEDRELGSDMGYAELSYKSGPWTVSCMHLSVISQYDAGLDIAMVKYTLIGD